MRSPILGITTLLILLAPLHLQGQVVLPSKGEETSLHQSVFGLGVFGGAATGLGLSFRHHLPSPLSYQVTGGIINVDDKLKYDVGIEAQWDLVRGPTGRFFAAGATSYFFSGKGGNNEMDGPGRVGLGVGGEVFIGNGFHLSAELLFTYFSDDTVLPLPQFGMFYYFK